MYGICLRYTKREEDAQDVMQEGFIKIYNALDSFKGESKYKTWMARIMVNTAINHYRQNKKLELNTVDEKEVEVLKYDNDDVLNQMSADELLKLINELPDGYRIIFNMYVIEGYKHREISEMLGITEGTSKSQLAKARQKVQELLKNQLGITREELTNIGTRV
jgi:RNA polymerase sigma-70 factor (ECF subfamily)